MSSVFVLWSWWPLLALAPLAWWAAGAVDRARARRLARLVGPRVGDLARELSAGQRDLRRACAGGATALALLAVLQPTWGVERRRDELRGIDLVVCLDVSRSMLARDADPDRLEAARAAVRHLAEHARGDRMALVAFAGEARLVVPLTRDLATFQELVALADPDSVQRGGTNLAAALEVAGAALAEASVQHAAVLLLTDGEDHDGRGLEAARALAERGVAVHTLGMGSARGSKIVVAEDGRERFLQDAAGRDVVSVMDPASLARIAEATGGSFRAADQSPRPLIDLYEDRVRPLAERSFGVDERVVRKNRFQWPLLLAVLLLLVELGVSERRRA